MKSIKMLAVTFLGLMFSASGTCQTKEIYKLPSGPDGRGTFGAYYTRLNYDPQWDKDWRVGKYADVVVRFDNGGERLVFWRGTSYIPCWVTDNGKWYTNEFVERRGNHSVNTEGCVEPMSDKQCRYSQVSIIESNEARVVIHWRYAPVDVRYEHPFIDPATGWYDWVDEYYVIYPDATGVREIIVRSGNLNKWIELQEAIVINQPGTLPEENIEEGAVTVANMQGDSKTYYWGEHSTGNFNENPPGSNIAIINLKSNLKPFAIVPPPPYDYNLINVYPGHGTNSMFNWWDHWPVSQFASDGRDASSAERPSHSSLCHIGLRKDSPVDCWGTEGYKAEIVNGALGWTVGDWSDFYLKFSKTVDLKDSVLISFDYANLWASSLSILFSDTDGEVREFPLEEFKNEISLNQPTWKTFSKTVQLSMLKGNGNVSDICEVFFKLSSKDQKRTVKLDNINFKSLKAGPNSLDYTQGFDVPDGTVIEEMNINKYGGWEPYAVGKDSLTKIMLHGLTDKDPQYLALLAKSWINPPKIEITSDGFEIDKYDPTQLAYIIRQYQNQNQPLSWDVLATKESPMVNPAFIIQNWGSSETELIVNGKSLVRGTDYRTGLVETLDNNYLVVWIKMKSEERNSFSIIPIER
jgi:hypothetical protein